MTRPHVESLPPERGCMTPTDALYSSHNKPVGACQGKPHSSASSVRHPVSRCSHYSWSPASWEPREQFVGESPGHFRTKGDNGSTDTHTGTQHCQRDRRHTICNVSKQTGPCACVLVLVLLVAKT